MQKVSFKNIGLAGGFLFIVANGTKDWSVDREKNMLDYKKPAVTCGFFY